MRTGPRRKREEAVKVRDIKVVSWADLANGDLRGGRNG